MDGIPHERSLVKRFAGRPFVMLGINVGELEGEVSDYEKEYDITWRSFVSTESGAPPKIVDDLELDGAGLAMLIDARGVIRYKGSEAKLVKQLDDEIEALLQEAEGADKASKE